MKIKDQFKYQDEYYDDVPLKWNCKDCVHFKFFVDGKCNGCTKRVDHKFIESYAPYFVNVTEERSGICSEFIPKIKVNGLYEWKGVKHYLVARHRAEMRNQDKYKMSCWNDYLSYAENNLQKAYMINGDRKNTYYGNWIDYFSGTNIENGKLKVNTVLMQKAKGSKKVRCEYIEIPKERLQIMGLKNDLLKARSATGTEAWSMMVENRLNKLFIEDTQTHDRYGLHASAIIASENEFCYREQVLSLFYKMNQGELLPISTLRVFAQGNAMHEKWYSLFRKAGIDVAIERTLFLPEYDLNFTIDALLNIFNEEVICDVKSVNTFIFNKQKGHPSGEKQINFYCWALTKCTGFPHRKGFVLMDSKNDQNFRVVPVKYSKEKVAPYVERLKEIQCLKKIFIDTGKLPKKKCENSKCKRAEKCNMHDACFKCGMGRIKLPKDLVERKGE